MQVTGLAAGTLDQVADRLERPQDIVHQHTVAGNPFHGCIQKDHRKRQMGEMGIIFRRHLGSKQDHAHTVRELDLLNLPFQLRILIQISHLHPKLRFFAAGGNPLRNLGKERRVPHHGAVLLIDTEIDRSGGPLFLRDPCKIIAVLFCGIQHPFAGLCADPVPAV